MIIEYPRENARRIAHIFHEHQFLSSVIESAIATPMGQFWVDDIQDPSVALVAVGFQFLAGDYKSEAVEELLEHIPSGHDIVVPIEEWVKKLEQKWDDRLEIFQRFSFSPDNLNLNHIRNLKSQLPTIYSIKQINHSIASELPKELVSTLLTFFGTPERFMETGVGFCVFHNEQPVSLAMSGHPFEKEFEIQVDTLNDSNYRRKGLATSVCAALIEYALENGLTPHWDAENESSKNLALKLGYTNPVEYSIYRWKSSTQAE